MIVHHINNNHQTFNHVVLFDNLINFIIVIHKMISGTKMNHKIILGLQYTFVHQEFSDNKTKNNDNNMDQCTRLPNVKENNTYQQEKTFRNFIYTKTNIHSEKE